MVNPVVIVEAYDLNMEASAVAEDNSDFFIVFPNNQTNLHSNSFSHVQAFGARRLVAQRLSFVRSKKGGILEWK